MSIIQSDTDPRNVEAIIENIKGLNEDELELLWDWFNSKTVVGGMLLDIPESKKECGNCSRIIDENETRCERCKNL